MTLSRFGLDLGHGTPAPSSTTGAPSPGPEVLTPDPAGFLDRVSAGSEQLQEIATIAQRDRRRPSAIIASDMDVDGITSHTILRTLLSRLGYDVTPVLKKKFDDTVLRRLLDFPGDLVVITDHAAPARDTFGDRNVLVIDHHKPPDPSQDHSHQLHPMLYGLNGSTEICSAGIAYLLARATDPKAHRDLAAIGVIGSAGDMMDHEKGRFIGLTASEVLADAHRFKQVDKSLDIRLYGRHGRTLAQLLCYADDPAIKGLSKNMDACSRFLTAQGLNPSQHWHQLDDDTRRRLVGELLERASNPTRLLGEVYELTREAPGSHLRDVHEYATVINGSSRYEMPEPVIAVLLGDRGKAYETALSNYLDHKRNIVQAIALVEKLGVTQGRHLQWFHVEGLVRHTIVGSVAGAVQSRHEPDKPIIAFAYEADDLSLVKVSGRGHRALCEAGLDLSAVMREAGAAVGGKGGGHDVAAGATIPLGQEPAFLAHAEKVLAGQIGHLHPTARPPT